MKIVFGILLLLHGFIVAAQSSGSFKPTSGAANPAWMTWFPVNLGQSWLFTKLNIASSAGVKALGVVWLIAGVALMLAALGVFGFLVPASWWRILALAGAVLSLVLLTLYFHPFYLVGFGASLLLLIALVSKNWGVLAQIGL